MTGFLGFVLTVDGAEPPSVVSEFIPEPINIHADEHPRLTEKEMLKGVEPMAVLPPTLSASSPEFRAMMDNNRGVGRTLQNGFTRTLDVPVQVKFSGAHVLSLVPGSPIAYQGGRLLKGNHREGVWVGTVEVRNAYRLRLRLNNVQIPGNARFWVADSKGRLSNIFATELIDSQGGLWTPSVKGPHITLIASASVSESQPVSFNISAVAELFELDPDGLPVAEERQPEGIIIPFPCLVDSNCIGDAEFEGIDAAKFAIGRMEWMNGSTSDYCTGGLINDTDLTTTQLFFLTANHCISSDYEARSLEVTWDYLRSGCGSGVTPDVDDLPKSNGSEIMYTHVNGDVTLLKLFNIPAGRWLMGWIVFDASMELGLQVYRLHHLGGGPQRYTRSTMNINDSYCNAVLSGVQFMWSHPQKGYTDKGSSGAPAMVSTGQIIGQLRGKCGEDTSDLCNGSAYADVDGDMYNYWPAVSPFLNPGAPHSCSYTLLEPNGGESWSGGDDRTINWSRAGHGCAGLVRVDLYKGGSWYRTLGVVPGADGLMIWPIQAGFTTASDYTIRLTDTSNSGWGDESDEPFSITMGEDDNYEENDTRQSAFDLSEHEATYLSTIDDYGVQLDDDWYRVFVDEESNRLIVELSFQHALGDIDIALYDAYGNYLTASTSVTDNEKIDRLVPSNRFYYLRVYYDDIGNEYELSWYDSLVNDEVFDSSFE